MRVAEFAIAVLFGSAILGLSAAQSCIENIEEIYTAESSVTDTTRRRTYFLCSRRIFEIGTLTHNFDLRGVNVHPPLPIRPNMTIRCGDTGSRENLCWVAEGDVQVDATPYRGIADATVEGVSIEGIVFIGAKRYSTWATKPGDITFKDCEWRDHIKSVVPIMMDWFDGSTSELSISFDGCSFHDNKYFGWGSHTSLIYANGQQNALRLKDTVFEKNDMLNNNTMSLTNSFIIESLGPVTMERTCFNDNAVGVSSVAVFGNSFSNIDNHQSNSTGDLCGFASVFETLQQFDNFAPLCVSAGNDVCAIGGTSSPTTSPTIAPTSSPTNSPTTPGPTVSPTTASPTITPAPTPTAPPPTGSPTDSVPTAAPTTTRPPIGFVFPTEAPAVTSDGGGNLFVTGIGALSLCIAVSLLCS